MVAEVSAEKKIIFNNFTGLLLSAIHGTFLPD